MSNRSVIFEISTTKDTPTKYQDPIEIPSINDVIGNTKIDTPVISEEKLPQE